MHRIPHRFPARGFVSHCQNKALRNVVQVLLGPIDSFVLNCPEITTVDICLVFKRSRKSANIPRRCPTVPMKALVAERRNSCARPATAKSARIPYPKRFGPLLHSSKATKRPRTARHHVPGNLALLARDRRGKRPFMPSRFAESAAPSSYCREVRPSPPCCMPPLVPAWERFCLSPSLPPSDSKSILRR